MEYKGDNESQTIYEALCKLESDIKQAIEDKQKESASKEPEINDDDIATDNGSEYMSDYLERTFECIEGCVRTAAFSEDQEDINLALQNAKLLAFYGRYFINKES